MKITGVSVEPKESPSKSGHTIKLTGASIVDLPNKESSSSSSSGGGGGIQITGASVVDSSSR
eukprot:3796020-Ditylum_brightwellii.AAC.1